MVINYLYSSSQLKTVVAKYHENLRTILSTSLDVVIELVEDYCGKFSRQ